MVHRLTGVWVRDGSGGLKLVSFYAYPRWGRGYVRYGEYGKGVIRTLASLPKPIRGRRYRPLRVGHLSRYILSGGLSLRGQSLSTYSRFLSPGVALLKRRGLLRSAYVFGPLCRPRPTKQFYGSYPSVL